MRVIRGLEMSFFVFLAAFVVFLLPASNIYADTAPFFIGGVNIKPYQESNIVLSKENLTITFNKSDDPRNSTASVNAQFIFVNTGDKVSLKVGFPFSLASRPGFDTTSTLESLKVKVKVDGNQITPTFVAPGEHGEYAPLIYFDVTFDKNETKEIQVSYEGKAAGGYFLYVLNTGSYWKGPIGTLDMTFKFPYKAAAPNVFSIMPGGYKIDGNEVVYHLVNYEPVQNIEVEFLPYYMYEKVNPLRLKAEATNNASDWFDYAMAFFPENPIGSMDEFVGWYRTPGFRDYVESILKKAVSLQEEGSPEQVVLQEVYSAHYEAPASFAEGLDAVLKLDGNHISLPSTSLDILRENIGSIENATEGKILGYVMEYAVAADLKQNRPTQALSDFDQLLELADKYFDKDTYYSVSPVLSMAMQNNIGKGVTKYVSPPFTQCFIPSVSLKNQTLTAHYNVPYDLGLALEDFDTNNDQNPPKDYRIVGALEKAPPYGYVVTVTFPKGVTESQFASVKETLTQLGNDAFDVAPDSQTAKLLSSYFGKILDNVMLENGKFAVIKSSVASTPELEMGLADLSLEIRKITNAQQQFKDTTFDEAFAQTMLSYLSTNKAYFDNLPRNSAITFGAVAQTGAGGPTSQSLIIAIMASLVAVLLIAFVLVTERKSKVEDANAKE